MKNTKEKLIKCPKSPIDLKSENIDLSDILMLSDRKLSEDARLIKNYFVELIRHMPNNVYWVDKNGVTLGCNDNVLKFVGVERLNEVVGKSYEEIAETAGWTEEQVMSFKRADQEVIMTGRPKINVEEPVFYDKEGHPIYYLSSRLPLFDEKNAIIGIVGISVNIADQKEKERLYLENKILQEQLETTRLFAASIAHELRTPWGGVHLITGLLAQVMPILIKSYRRALEAGLLNDERRENLLTEEMTQGALEIEKDLKKFAYAAKIFIDMMLLKVNLTGLEASVMEDLSMVASIDKALELYPLTKTERRLIHWSHAENLPHDFMFRGDQTLFNHLMFNLIKNALFYVKYANKGEILIWLSQENGTHVLHFKDTGMGMNEEVQANLFKAFFSRTRHGTGVGLALCKKIMTDWGGSIECQSVQNEYTHFIMRFPAIQQAK